MGAKGAETGAVLRALREPAAVIAPDGTVRDVNGAWDLLARRPDAPPVITAAIGASLPGRCRTAQLGGFQSGPAIASGIEDVLHGLRSEFDAEYAWSMGGTERSFLLTIVPVKSDPPVALLLHREITAQKLGQEALSRAWDFYMRIFDDFPALIWRSTPDGRPSYFNRTWIEFTGRTVEQQRGDGWLAAMHPADREGYLIASSTAIAQRRPFQIEFRLRRSDGEYRWLLGAARPYHDLERAFAGYLCVASDITEARRAEAAAIEARSAARAAELREADAQAELMARELGHYDEIRGADSGFRRVVGLAPLSESAPDVFDQLSRRYGELMELALDRATYRDVTGSPSNGLRDLGDRLGDLRAGPRDVVELHARVMREKTSVAQSSRRQAYLNEGRLMALELMGHVAAYYRLRTQLEPVENDGSRSLGQENRRGR